MKIDEFPVEILMHIFNYLPKYDNVFLVNKRFYSVACKVFDPTICLELNMFDMSLARLQSIKATNRNITNINVCLMRRLDEKAFKATMDIIKKFSATIKQLRFSGYLEMPSFLNMLSLVPNAEHLVFDGAQTRSGISQPLQKKRRVMSRMKDLNLYNLKILEFSHCNDAIVAVFNKLPDGVLTDLLLDNINLNELGILFRRQTNIKNLALDWYVQNTVPAIPPDIFDNQQLEYLKFYTDFEQIINIDIILSKQKKLKSLEMIDTICGDKFMKVVVEQLTDLETLLLNVSEMPPASLKNIRKMKNLRHLTLQSDEEDRDLTPFEEFAKLDNSKITTLDIQNVNNFSADVIKKLAKSMPNLKTLRFNCDYDIRVFNAIMESFNFVETLDFGRYDEYDHDQSNDGDNNLILGDCFNPKLLDLNIVYTLPYKRPFLKMLIKNYPNLKKLVLASEFPLTSVQFKLIFDGFEKMESLTLMLGASKLLMKDLKFLKNRHTHLKCVSLMDMKKINDTDGVMNMLRTTFDVVKFHRGQETLQMAVDRKSIESEKCVFRFS